MKDGARREANEETSLNIHLVDILGVYSDPKRDPRGHLISTVFVGIVPTVNISMEASAQDDASEVKWINLEAIIKSDIVFDHKKILFDYKLWKESGGTFWSSKDESNLEAV